MAKLLQSEAPATYQLFLVARRLEIAFYEHRSRVAEDRYSPILLQLGERVTIHAWPCGTDVMAHAAQILTIRCALDGIHCSENIEMHLSSEERPVPFLLFVRAEVEPFEHAL